MSWTNIGYTLFFVALFKSLALILLPYAAILYQKPEKFAKNKSSRNGYSSPVPFWEVPTITFGYFVSGSMPVWLLLLGWAMVFFSYLQLWMFAQWHGEQS